MCNELLQVHIIKNGALNLEYSRSCNSHWKVSYEDKTIKYYLYSYSNINMPIVLIKSLSKNILISNR